MKTHTPSPLEDKKTKEDTKKILENKIGKDSAKELKQQENIPTSSKQLDDEMDEDYINFVKSKEKLGFDFMLENLQDVDHLDLYNEMDNNLGLVGESYKTFKRGLWYFQHSSNQETQTLRINNKTTVDNRFSILGIGPASSGKSTAKNQIKSVVSKNDYHEVTGLSHDQQLIGTVEYKGKGDNKKAIQIPGILSYKVVVNDETQDMLNEKNDMYAKAQRTKRIAMDPYGLNNFSKKRTRDQKEDILDYCSESRILDLAHPKKLESPFFDTGSFRRYGSITMLEPDEEIKLEDVTEFKLEDSNKCDNYKELMSEYYTDKRHNIIFSQQTLDIISLFHKSLLVYLLKHKNNTAFRFGLLTRYSLRDYFCRNVLILSKSKNQETPTIQTTLSACCDTLMFILESIKSINNLGDMGMASDVWGGLNEQDAQAMEYLLRKGATDPDKSEQTIKNIWTILGHLYGCRVTQSRAHFYRLKKDGFIDSRKVGQYGSVAWLKFIPKEISVNEGEYDGINVWNDIIQSVGLEIDLLALLKEAFVDDKSFKKGQSVGSVGIMGCILIKKRICVEVEGCIDFKNIYNVGGKTPTLPTLSSKKPDLHVKKKIQTAKTPKTRPTLSKPKKQDSTRDLQYFEDPVCNNIIDCKPDDVLAYVKKHPKYKIPELVKMFGPGVIKLKAEGLIQ